MNKKLIIVVASLITSCSPIKDKTEKIKEYTIETKDYKLFGFTINGVLDGPVSEYYPDGKLRALWIAKKGEIHGKTVDYYPNGQLRLFQSFQNGKRNGYKYFFKRNGLLVYKILFINDVETGHSYFYDINGRPFLYMFKGYSNKLLFKQMIDTITGLQTIYGNVLMDDLFIVDTLKDETRVMVANPIGRLKPAVSFILTNNLGPSLDLQLNYINENNEYVYKGNILDTDPIYRAGIKASINIQNKQIKDGFFVDLKKCIYSNEFSTDSINKPIDLQ
jgi:hypothetical protein